jgi:hypothetical protein
MVLMLFAKLLPSFLYGFQLEWMIPDYRMPLYGPIVESTNDAGFTKVLPPNSPGVKFSRVPTHTQTWRQIQIFDDG